MSFHRFGSRIRRPRPDSSGRTLRHIENYIKESHGGMATPEPLENHVPTSFAHFDLPPLLLKAIEERRFFQPTPIQSLVIPAILKGHDVIGIANTGTGKTAAFLIPLITLAMKTGKTRVLIMAPTRELAGQIYTDFKVLASGSRLKIAGCIGGLPLWKQQQELKNEPEFIVGTPGRLKDLLNQGLLKLSLMTTVVLDEVDRMFDMGFIADVTRILERIPLHRHTLFFTATLPPEIERLCQTFGHQPHTLSVKTSETASTIRQEIMRMSGQDKMEMLNQLLMKRTEFKKVLVFGRTKRGVQRLADSLRRNGYPAGALHGNKTQPQRQRALEEFRKLPQAILVATDVAARGIDVTGITHVINYDIPETFEDYIHRIGRTGRAGQAGTAVTFA